MSLFNKKIPAIYTIAFGLLCSGASFWFFKIYSSPKAAATENISSTPGNDCNYNIARVKGYKYIKPLFDESSECESPRLAPLKQEIASYIDNQKQANAISTASVYIKEFSSDDWTYINPSETYLPGSLFKLPVMITILRMSETDPSLLGRKVLYDRRKVINVPQTYNSAAIQPGKSYTIKELLTYMIVHSDNAATQLLNQNINPDALAKVFSDLGLTPPKADASYFNYTISPRDYSVFMAALYNAGYLTIAESEYATSLLADCNFKDGLLKGLPENIKVAHKFGEAGNPQEHQLHETGIIYINNNAYLITVMTKGNDVKKLAETISNISRIAYNRMKANA